MKLIPFDLQIALKHPERVRHTNGKSAIRVAHFPEADESHRVVMQFDGMEFLDSFTEDGRNTIESKEPSLFLTAETKLVPWELHEIPVGMYYRSKGQTAAAIISGGCNGFVWIRSSNKTTQSLLDDYEHAPHPFAPESDWKPCGKEVEA